MYLQVRPGMINLRSCHLDFMENDGRKFSVSIAQRQYSRNELIKAIVTVMKSAGAQSYDANTNNDGQLLTIRSPQPFALLGNSGANADQSIMNHLGFGIIDTDLRTAHTAFFPIDTPLTPFIDVQVAELPPIGTKEARVRVPNRTQFTGVPETQVSNIVTRVPIFTTTDSEQERIYYRAEDTDLITQPFQPMTLDKMTFAFFDQYGNTVDIGEHNITLMVHTESVASRLKSSRPAPSFTENFVSEPTPGIVHPSSKIINLQTFFLFILTVVSTFFVVTRK